MGGQNNTLAPNASPVVLAFYTTGDSRPSEGIPANAPAAAKLTNSQRYQIRAQALATSGQVYGVDGIANAVAAIQNLPNTLRLDKVYFVGHGFTNGYFFTGTPVGADDFSANDNQVLKAPSSNAQYQKLTDELAKHFTAADRFEIGFISCYSGASGFIYSIKQAMDAKGFGNFLIGGYKNWYQTRYNYDLKSGAVVSWNDVTLNHQNNTKIADAGVNQLVPYEVTGTPANPNDPLQGILP